MNDMSFPGLAKAAEEPLRKLRAQLSTRRAVMVLAPIGVLALGVIAAQVLIATGPKPEKKDGPAAPVAVQVAMAEARQSRLSVIVQGEALPRSQAALSAQVGGRIVAVSHAFVDGGAFRKGDVLVTLENADYRLGVVRARAQVAQAEEALAREEAEADLARQDWQSLGKGDASPLTLREPQLAQARAQRDAAKAQLQSAELDLSRAQIRAPFDGRVRTKRVSVGDYAAPGSPVADVFATDIMEVRVPLTDSDLATLETPVGFIAGKQAPRARLTAIVAGKPRTWTGKLVRTDAVIDSRTRLVYGYVEVRDPFGRGNAAPLAPGLFVTAHLDGANSEPLVAAPRAALKKNEIVYVLTPQDTVEIRTVRPAETTIDEVLFRAGLKHGERVITSHLPSPRAGMKVTPMLRR